MTWLMCRLIKILNDASQQITTLFYIKRACEFKQVTYLLALMKIRAYGSKALQ